jgi:hypothetical protein
MIELLPKVFDAIGLLGFGTALIGLIITPASSEEGSLYTPAVKWTFILAWTVYLFVCGSDVLEKVFNNEAIDAFEGPVEMIFPVVIILGAYAAFSAQQYSDLQLSRRALNSAQTLMLEVLDRAPAGILFVGPTGAIAFANECAKEILELTEDADGWFSAPWMSDHDIKQIFGPALVDGTGKDIVLVFDWPGQRRLELRAASEPMLASEGRSGGSIVTFERP